MTSKTRPEILSDLQEILSDFQGQTYDAPIDEQTMFFQDLGFASIDAVVLGETLEEHFQTKLDFNPFLSELAAKQVKDLQVSELVDFLHRSL
ncbi:hypothetical protein CA51_02640 [Rosistilla oblonga]|uniref:acyl carrier protein n=1 Tax=Rosistilla oblonga TaxID=2527990 RepID=UPI00118897A0|nr:phosphopantetheine-binding protein [Rosistilla oblonga]QDV10415.1 hypothetical protein CA51_02640 [Rosistilla oblonga]